MTHNLNNIFIYRIQIFYTLLIFENCFLVKGTQTNLIEIHYLLFH